VRIVVEQTISVGDRLCVTGTTTALVTDESDE